MSSIKKFAIVDGYSSGRLLAQCIKQQGWSCYHIQSTKNPSPFYTKSYDSALFERSYCYAEQDEKNLLNELVRLNIDFVIPGAEPGVLLADRLSEKLNLLSNGTALSHARRNKYDMIETIKNKGLAATKQFKTSSIEELLSWVEDEHGYPVVIKPLNSAGADNVSICHDTSEVKNAYNKIMQQPNLMGDVNQEVLAQTFLKGTEYIVNTVSRDGKHYVCDIWKCHKKQILGAGSISVMEELIESNSEIANCLEAYAYSILDALGIQHGPAHHEIMYTESGPVLIEVGARIQGAINPASINFSKGDNQVQLTVKAYADPEKFMKKIGKKYQVNRYMNHCFMISNTQGILKSMPHIQQIQNMPSFYAYMPWVNIGEEIKQTLDLGSSAGVIDLIHEDKSQLNKDYIEYRHLEEGGFYEV